MEIDPKESNAFVDTKRKEAYPSTSLSDPSTITSFSIFESLTFWNKLEFIKNTVDKKLLKEIQEKTESKQLGALALHRSYQLEL